MSSDERDDERDGTVQDGQLCPICVTDAERLEKDLDSSFFIKYKTGATNFAGNDSVITGPGKALLKLTYDETYSNVKTSSTYVADGADPLVETVDFDLASGKPSKSTEPNGSTPSLVYDVLGRVQKQTFETDGTYFCQIPPGPGRAKPPLEDGDTEARQEDQMVCSEIEYDGSNRTVAQSRDYLEGTTPVYTKFKYDALSRQIEQTIPATNADVPSLTITTKYSFAGVAKITDTKSKGDGDDALNTRDILYQPNHEQAANKFVLPYVIAATDELQQTIRTTFDALG
ncbi:hypothetical protein HGRIS_006537 [Hohenbuehelia grisea]|uniref:Uncharacterized protein n=1 Tax=Hohenbuehelia grisea TaxID=104357 RepID=A0ABR3J9T6_9AGAR